VDAYRVLQDALNTMRYTLSLKRLNQELYDHLCGSITYIINYSEKNDIILSNKENLLQLIVKSHDYIDAIKERELPSLSKEIETDESLHSYKKARTDGDFTEP
jgi:hypothetical protein